jgi:formamidopyrimidine-DNA glycosylase
MYQGVTSRRFAATLTGRRVLSVRRRGKHLWLELDRRPWPAFHFGMTGGFDTYPAGSPRPRFWKLELTSDDRWCLALHDARRFGRIRLQHDPPTQPPISQLGFDPLDETLPVAAFLRLFERRKAPVKAVLLDQSAFAGVGNWLADEVLYQSGIRPDRPAEGLTEEEVRRMRQRLRAIVRTAVAAGADSERFPRGWLFAHRWGRNQYARTAKGERIVHQTVAGRTTAWVPDRQR